jgi:hypothetical protein
MNEQLDLVLGLWLKGGGLAHKCSSCGQLFILPEDVNPKEGMIELWAAFSDHAREMHPQAIGSAQTSWLRSLLPFRTSGLG